MAAYAFIYYHTERLTRYEIAALLCVHRTPVNRILAQARNRSIFKVHIKNPVNLAAERALGKQFALKQVVLVQTTQKPYQLTASIANAAGAIA